MGIDDHTCASLRPAAPGSDRQTPSVGKQAREDSGCLHLTHQTPDGVGPDRVSERASPKLDGARSEREATG